MRGGTGRSPPCATSSASAILSASPTHDAPAKPVAPGFASLAPMPIPNVDNHHAQLCEIKILALQLDLTTVVACLQVLGPASTSRSKVASGDEQGVLDEVEFSREFRRLRCVKTLKMKG